MSKTDWEPIARRITHAVDWGRSFANAGNQTLARSMKPEIEECYKLIGKYLEQFEGSFLPLETAALKKIVEVRLHRLSGWDSYQGIEVILEMLLEMSTAEARISFALSGSQEFARASSLRAFEHLRRSIQVDCSTQRKWQTAFAENEVACEKLASVHLLAHGIWAFKCHAQGERTDLVYSDAIGESRLNEVRRTSTTLVLTEWKLCRDGDNPTSKFEEAKKQAEIYTASSLRGLELDRYRFAIVVSKEQVQVPEDVSFNEYGKWIHVNIPVNPVPPSVAARKQK